MHKILLTLLLGLFLLTGCDNADSGDGQDSSMDTTAKADDTPPPPPPPAFDYDENGIWFGPEKEIPVIKVGDSIRINVCVEFDPKLGEGPIPQFRGMEGLMSESAYCASFPVVGVQMESKNAEGYYEMPYSVQAEIFNAKGEIDEFVTEGVVLVADREE